MSLSTNATFKSYGSVLNSEAGTEAARCPVCWDKAVLAVCVAIFPINASSTAKELLLFSIEAFAYRSFQSYIDFTFNANSGKAEVCFVLSDKSDDYSTQ